MGNFYDPISLAKRENLMNLLTALEGHLRRRDWWEEQSPPPAALNSREPFCVDYLSFSQWLQWIYIPKMRSLDILPQRSGLLPIAEEAWKGCADIVELLRLVEKLDGIINET